MIEKDFWRKSKVAVIGGGNWGTVLAHLVAGNCGELRLWVREEENARQINSTRSNPAHFPFLHLPDKLKAFSELDRVFEGGVDVLIWALPSSACREQAPRFAPYLKGDELILHATKGVEPGTLKRISEILGEELPSRRIGVISGPNLAEEIARGQPAATVVASPFDEVVIAGQALLSSPRFRVYGGRDVVGVEWAGSLKNILAIAAGAVDALQLGWNSRSMLITRGLAEMVRFGVAMGGEEATFLGLAGVGDLLATCSSPLSRNYRVGERLARGEGIDSILSSLGSTAEGVRTTESVWKYAQAHGISMPITEGVHVLLQGASVQEVLQTLMSRPTPLGPDRT